MLFDDGLTDETPPAEAKKILAARLEKLTAALPTALDAHHQPTGAFAITGAIMETKAALAKLG